MKKAKVRIVVLLCILMACFFTIAKSFGNRVNTNSKPLERNEEKFQHKLLDPAQRDFWREGNHIPDEGFLQLAMNPSVQNAKIWLLRNEIKAQRMQLIMKFVDQAHAELVKSGQIEDRYDVFKVPSRRSLPVYSKGNPKNLERLQFYFLFSPSCPFCLKMADQLKGLPNVSPLQVVEGNLRNFPGLPSSDFASNETVRTYAPDGRVPVLVIYLPERKRAKIIKGARTKEQIISESQKLMEGK